MHWSLELDALPADAELPEPLRELDLVIAAFGCNPPPVVRRSLAPVHTGPPPALWLNLEYLTAEAWIDSCHGLSSIKPQDGARETFFFPGFSEASGGLLREAGLIERRRAFDHRPHRTDWLAAQGLLAADAPAGDPRVSVFCYDHPASLRALRSLAEGPRRLQLLIAEGVAESALRTLAGCPLPSGSRTRIGSVTVNRFGWLDQDGYDRLLWSCDLNVVRGEDSWIRAHWAGRPFIWQPYPQDGEAHLGKLDAWIERAMASAPCADQAVLRALSHAWSGDGDPAAAWAAFTERLGWDTAPGDARSASSGALADELGEFCDGLAAQPDLAARIMAWFREQHAPRPL